MHLPSLPPTYAPPYLHTCYPLPSCAVSTGLREDIFVNNKRRSLFRRLSKTLRRRHRTPLCSLPLPRCVRASTYLFRTKTIVSWQRQQNNFQRNHPEADTGRKHRNSILVSISSKRNDVSFIKKILENFNGTTVHSVLTRIRVSNKLDRFDSFYSILASRAGYRVALQSDNPWGVAWQPPETSCNRNQS